jgi:hypothetical protein
MNDWQGTEVHRENLPHHFVYHRSHMTSLGLEPRLS